MISDLAQVSAALAALRAVARQEPPDDLRAWADRCDAPSGFPLLGTDRRAEPYVALQWNGDRAARAGLGRREVVILAGLVAAWEHDRTTSELADAVATALDLGAEAVRAAGADSPVTYDVVPAAVAAGLLSGVPEDDLPTLVDLTGTLMQVTPLTSTAQSRAMAAGHCAAAGWLAVQTHLAGLVAYPGAFADTVGTAGLPDTQQPLTDETPVRTVIEELA
jgi:hypothetical protein